MTEMTRIPITTIRSTLGLWLCDIVDYVPIIAKGDKVELWAALTGASRGRFKRVRYEVAEILHEFDVDNRGRRYVIVRPIDFTPSPLDGGINAR